MATKKVGSANQKYDSVSPSAKKKPQKTNDYVSPSKELL